VPEPRPVTAALREAEQVLGGPCVLVRPLSRRDGFAVVREERGEAGNGYEQELVARVENETAVPALCFSPVDRPGRTRPRSLRAADGPPARHPDQYGPGEPGRRPRRRIQQPPHLLQTLRTRPSRLSREMYANASLRAKAFSDNGVCCAPRIQDPMESP
jgi:hypothetical protein